MPISNIRLLPPFAIARFGSSSTPLEAFELAIADDASLGFRQIVPQETLEVDEESGSIRRMYVPRRIQFKDGDTVRPVAPFLELFAQTGPDTLEPLTLSLLEAEGLGPEAVQWSVDVANLKVYRQTTQEDDKVTASLPQFNDHAVHELQGRAVNFLRDKYIPFGRVRYIRPTAEFPQIRLRFTPGAGNVYGSSPRRFDPVANKLVDDPVFRNAPERIVYDAQRGSWLNFEADSQSKLLPNPSDIYQGYVRKGRDLATSWGYLDDVCDGRISARLTTKQGVELTSSAWISACMPVYAPDSLPIRTVADELEQLVLGPEIDDREVSIDEAAEIVRRALETIRLMNTAAMNANTVDGRDNIASTLFRQDTNDMGRRYEPGMASSIVDNLAVRALHERVYAALRGGTAPWFADVLRRPEEIGDLSDKARRKMPPMLRGADSRALTLTRRQISKIVRATTYGLFAKPPLPSSARAPQSEDGK